MPSRVVILILHRFVLYWSFFFVKDTGALFWHSNIVLMLLGFFAFMHVILLQGYENFSALFQVFQLLPVFQKGHMELIFLFFFTKTYGIGIGGLDSWIFHLLFIKLIINF